MPFAQYYYEMNGIIMQRLGRMGGRVRLRGEKQVLDSAKQKLVMSISVATTLCLMLMALVACQNTVNDNQLSGSYELKMEHTTYTYTFSDTDQVKLEMRSNVGGAALVFNGTYSIVRNYIIFTNWDGGRIDEAYTFERTGNAIILNGIECKKL